MHKFEPKRHITLPYKQTNEQTNKNYGKKKKSLIEANKASNATLQ